MLLSAEFQTSFFFCRGLLKDVSQDSTPLSQNNSVIETVMTNSNCVWYIIHEMSRLRIRIICRQSKPAGRKEGNNMSDAPFMMSQLVLFSSSMSHSALCHRYQSFLTPVCPSLLSHCPISFSVGRNCLFLEVCFCGWNTPPLQAASSLSAHHKKHDSPPSVWC